MIQPYPNPAYPIFAPSPYPAVYPLEFPLPPILSPSDYLFESRRTNRVTNCWGDYPTQPPNMPYSVSNSTNNTPTTGNSRMRIIYNNDPHEKLLVMPQLTSAIRHYSYEGEQQGRDTFRLNGGDNNIGNDPSEWDLNVQLMNLQHYDGVAMGNHEMDLGPDAYAKGLEKANFTTFVSNLSIPADTPMAQRVNDGKINVHSKILNEKQGQYGLLGVTTPNLANVTLETVAQQGILADAFETTCKKVQEEVNRLQQQGINRIVLLSHMGSDLDTALAKRVSGIDVIVCGHNHKVLKGIVPEETVPGQSTEKKEPNYVLSPTGEPVMLVEAGKDGKYAGVLDLSFTPTGQVIPESNQVIELAKFPKDGQAQAIISETLGPPEHLATLATPYENENIPFQEDAMAEFCADAARSVCQSDIAFVRSAEIRNSLQPGPITNQDLPALMPFPDPFVKLMISGKDILGALKRSGDSVMRKDNHPGLLHPSGLTYTIDAGTGQISDVYVWHDAEKKWEPLKPDQQYTVAVGEFTVKNPREFTELAQPGRVLMKTELPMAKIFERGLQNAGAPARLISLKADGRLKIKPGKPTTPISYSASIPQANPQTGQNNPFVPNPFGTAPFMPQVASV